MKKITKILFVILVIIILIAGAVYIDYFIAKRNNIAPKIAIKKVLSDEEIVYKAVLYKVWYCKENNSYVIGGYDDVDAICPKKYIYEDGYYTNEAGLKISQENIEIMSYNGIYSREMIDNMADENSVENAVYVAYNYSKLLYMNAVDEEGNDKVVNDYQIIIFPEFINKDNDFNWEYNNNEEYCLKEVDGKKYYAPLTNNTCDDFKELTVEKEWCNLYGNSMLSFDSNANKLCKE